MKRLLYILVLLLLPYSVSAKTKAEKMGWNLAVQTFTFYPTDLCTVIDKSLELGVKYLEVFPGQKIGGKWGDRVQHLLREVVILLFQLPVLHDNQ